MALQRFLGVILPPKALADHVLNLRTVLFQHIGSFGGRKLLPHLTLFLADVDAALEPTVIRLLREGVQGRRSFHLGYHGITHFPNRRVIYVDPVEKERIAEIRSPIVESLRQDPVLLKALRETGHPHLTIAAGLKLEKFKVAWELLAPHQLNADGRVGEVVLMRRPLQAGSAYQELQRFPLG